MSHKGKRWPYGQEKKRANAMEAAIQIALLMDEARKDIHTNPLNAALCMADAKALALYIQQLMMEARMGEDE